MRHLFVLGFFISAKAQRGAHEVECGEGTLSLLQKSAAAQMLTKNITADKQGGNGLGQKSTRKQEQHAAEQIKVVKEDNLEWSLAVNLNNTPWVIAETADSRKHVALLDGQAARDTKVYMGKQSTEHMCTGGLQINYKYPLPSWGPWNPGGFCWGPYQQSLVIALGITIVAKILHDAFMSKDNQGLQNPTTTASQTERQTQWDFFRFVVEVMVVAQHIRLKMQPVPDFAILRLSEPFRMPMFIFISGVFGRSVKYDSIANMCCYTVVCFFLAGVWKGLMFGYSEYDWFLWAIFIFRLTITPCFHIVRKFQESHLVDFLFLVAVGCLSRLVFPTVALENKLSEIIYFASFFALGLLATPSQWMHIFVNRGFVAVSTVVNLAYIAIFCLYGKLWSHSNEQRLGVHLWGKHNIVLSQSIMFSYMIVVLTLFGWTTILCRAMQSFAPNVYELIIGWGRRTLYVYVLHGLFRDHLAGVPFLPLVNKIPQGYVFIVMSVGLNAFLGSEATKSLFKWALEPYWARRAVEQVFVNSEIAKAIQ